MIIRFSGATLGLLAFSVAVVGGLWAGNSATVILSRAIWSLVIFCALGFALGAAAQAVVEEYAHRRFDKVRAEVAEAVESAKAAAEAPDEQEDHDSGDKPRVQEMG